MTSAAFPFTVTTTGALTTAKGLAGNGLPGSTPGTTGPRPVANSDRISPCAAGLDTVTRVKSPEWVMAGPAGSIVTSGRAIGITWAIHRQVPAPPPLRRRLVGSSATEVIRATGDNDPICPRAPRNAPVPPVIARLCPPATLGGAVTGDPGGGVPPVSPMAVMVPIWVPSLFKI